MMKRKPKFEIERPAPGIVTYSCLSLAQLELLS